MIKTSIEKISESIGFDIGMSDDIVQSDLLNGLCKGLDYIKDRRSLDMQLCYITEKLNKRSMEIIKQLCEFIKLKQENNE